MSIIELETRVSEVSAIRVLDATDNEYIKRAKRTINNRLYNQGARLKAKDRIAALEDILETLQEEMGKMRETTHRLSVENFMLRSENTQLRSAEDKKEISETPLFCHIDYKTPHMIWVDDCEKPGSIMPLLPLYHDDDHFVTSLAI